MVINPKSVAALFIGFNTQFAMGINSAEGLFWKGLMMEVSSSNGVEEYDWMNAIGGLEELIGKPNIEQLTANVWQVKNKIFSKIVSVPRAQIERDKAGVYNPLFQELGDAAVRHPDEMLADLLENGFTRPCYTGSPFFSANQVLDSADRQSARLTNLGTKKLTTASFEEAMTAFLLIKNSKGKPVNVGTNFVLVVPPQLQTAAREIVEKKILANGSENLNAGAAKLVVNPYLTDANRWYIINAGRKAKPFVLQKEVPLKLIAQTAETSDEVFFNHTFHYQAYERGNAGYLLPQLAWASTGAVAG